MYPIHWVSTTFVPYGVNTSRERINNDEETMADKPHLFKQGNKLGGRKPGSLNRSTEQAKLAISRLANEGIDVLREDLEKIRQKDPLEAAKLYLRLLEYIVPKKASVEMRAEIDQRIHSISININKGNGTEY
jgi:hypothetical protein